jgi:hypothetical protein
MHPHAAGRGVRVLGLIAATSGLPLNSIHIAKLNWLINVLIILKHGHRAVKNRITRSFCECSLSVGML